MNETATAKVQVTKINAGQADVAVDFLACEEPLEIRLIHGNEKSRVKNSVSVTMRTPGNDAELAIGFLFTEGIIRSKNELKGYENTTGNIVEISLAENVHPGLQKLDRNFYTTSSCGVCGKASLDAIKTIEAPSAEKGKITVSPEVLYSLPALLRKTQQVFEQTGGLHAAAVFDTLGNLVLVREDVGRHNALDKLIGNCFLNDRLPLSGHILLLSGRASFELIQKAVMAGIRIVVAVGAPSSLAVELAKEFDMTLAGFLRDNRFNIYCGKKRIKGGSASFSI